MAVDIIAVLTDEGRSKLSNMLRTGECFTINKFSVSNGGHDPLNPNQALSPDPTLTILPGSPIFPKDITRIDAISQTCLQFVCFLAQGEATGQLSNLGLTGTMSDLTEFLFAIANFPLRNKLSTEEEEFFVTVQA